MRAWVFCLALAWPAVLQAGVFPALYDVTGVASNDVLNIRNSADATAEITGTLPPDGKGVEVLGLSPDGKWALVNGEQVSGYVALRFLVAKGGPDWLALEQPIRCFGTEPFWGMSFDTVAKTAQIGLPDGKSIPLAIQTVWPGTPLANVAGLALAGADTQTTAVLTGAACSDGMSDTAYGITATLFVRDAKGQNPQSYSGCCTISP